MFVTNGMEKETQRGNWLIQVYLECVCCVHAAGYKKIQKLM